MLYKQIPDQFKCKKLSHSKTNKKIQTNLIFGLGIFLGLKTVREIIKKLEDLSLTTQNFCTLKKIKAHKLRKISIIIKNEEF